MYDSVINIIKVSDYLNNIFKNEIDLNPEYQRGEIWSDKQKNSFITAQFKNSSPGIFVINKTKNNIRILDGKQRTITMINFKKNKCFAEINGEKIYYNSIPKNESTTARVMTNNEKKNWKNLKFSIQEYNNLTYSQEAEIFTNMQNGTSLSQGEKVIGYISSDKTALLFSNIANKLSDKFSLFRNIKRKDHHLSIMQYIYFIDNELNIKINDCRNYFKELDNTNELEKKLKICKKQLNWILLLLSDKKIPKQKKKKKIFDTILYGMGKYYIILEKEDDNKIINFLEKYIEKISSSDDIDLTEKFNDISALLFNIFKNMYNNIFIKKSDEIESDDEYSDSNNDNSEDDDNDNDNIKINSDNEEIIF